VPIVVGVRFRRAGKIYYFDPGGLDLKYGDKAVVETARGLEFGEVVIAPREVQEDSLVMPLKTVIRVGTEEDVHRVEENQTKQQEAFEVCVEKIKEHELPMKLIDVEYTFDNSKIIFYFTAEGRVDFRELVKNLAAIFRTRIELRQIGVRDEAKMVGGIGGCGRVLCCHAFLGDFEPVSIRMAKDQNLSLNPTKISGICGRLMCCLKYESEAYENMKALHNDHPAASDSCSNCSCPMKSGDLLKGAEVDLIENLPVDGPASSACKQCSDLSKDESSSEENPDRVIGERDSVAGAELLPLNTEKAKVNTREIRQNGQLTNERQVMGINRYRENGRLNPNGPRNDSLKPNENRNPKKVESLKGNDFKRTEYPKDNERVKTGNNRRSKEQLRVTPTSEREGNQVPTENQVDTRQLPKNNLSRNNGVGNQPTRKSVPSHRGDYQNKPNNPESSNENGVSAGPEQVKAARIMPIRSRNTNSHPTGGQKLAHIPSDLGD
jgi:cell fate regulator YaaT (PSP1 superfamily)